MVQATALQERFVQHNKFLDLTLKTKNPSALGLNEFSALVDSALARIRVDGLTIEQLDDIADNETHRFPHKLWKALGDAAMLGALVPEEYGGMGLGHAHEAITAMKLAEISASFSLSKVAHSDLFGRQMIKYGNEEQKNRFLPGVADGSLNVGLAMSEANAGTAVPKNIKTRAKKTEGGWILDGSKMWITNAVRKDPVTGEDIMADGVMVYAKTFDEKTKKDRVTVFLVEKGMPGFEAGQEIKKAGMRGSDTREIKLKSVFVPDANVIGKVHEGSSIMMDGLTDERLHLAAIMLGVARASWKAQVEYLCKRDQNGIVAYNDDVAIELAEMYKDIESLQQKLMDTAVKLDLGLIDSEKEFDLASSIFWDSSLVSEKVTSREKYHFGGNGQTIDYRADRRHRDQAVLHVGGGAINPARAKLVARRVVPGYMGHVKQVEKMRDAFNDRVSLSKEDIETLAKLNPALAEKFKPGQPIVFEGPNKG